MFCKFCGAEIDENSLFCSKCGAKQIKSEIVSSTAATESSIVSKEKKNIPEKVINIISKCCFWCFIAGIVGLGLFISIVLVGLIAYGEVYLFDGYDFTKVLSIISIVLMMIGLCSIIAKCILYFIFKIGKFPTTIVKRIFLIVLAVACLGCSIWGFVDCNNSSKYDYDDSGYNSSNGSSIGSYDNTVSKYVGLSLSVTKIETRGNYTYVYCSIKNVSHLYGNATMYRYVKVKAVFKDRSGSMLDTDWTYAIDSTWLNSGETKTFYYMVRNTSVKSATLSIVE